MKINSKKSRSKKLNPVTVVIALIMTNIITALSFGHQPQVKESPLSWESLYPKHSQVLLQIELKTPYKKKKEIILSNKERDFYLKDIIMIDRLGDHEEQASSFDYQSIQENMGTFTVLIPTESIEKLRGQARLIALPKNTPQLKAKRATQSKVSYELVY